MKFLRTVPFFALVLGACQQEPITVPERTFEGADAIELLCIRTYATDSAGNRTVVAPEPLDEAECSPLPGDATTDDVKARDARLYGLVTQTLRGEVAVVDLFEGRVIDTDSATPGINLVPVGQNPTGIAIGSDRRAVFVSTAEVNKPGIYLVPSSRLLGDFGTALGGRDGAVTPRIVDWPACGLPQPAGGLKVVPIDGGAGYVLVATLLPASGSDAKVITVDPRPLLRGAGLDTTAGDRVDPGALLPCAILSSTRLTTLVPPVTPKAAADGVPYVSGGVDLSGDRPESSQSTCEILPTAPAQPFAVRPVPGALVADGRRVYVADKALPIIHTIDVTSGGEARESAPLVATNDSGSSARLGALAISPETRNFERFLYAIDQSDGGIFVFDVTQVDGTPRGPLMRPHADLNPFIPKDRIRFGSAAVSVAFARHDWPLRKSKQGDLSTTRTGLLCNPNPNAGGEADSNAYRDEGAAYRANVSYSDVVLGPTRLRGVFAIVTLANGVVTVLDIDDWDAPCRRPDPLSAAGRVSSLAVPEPSASNADDLDPYHTPVAYSATSGSNSPVTLEVTFPVSVPHRARSSVLLRNDSEKGNAVPGVIGTPQLALNGAARVVVGDEGLKNPLIVPAAMPGFIDPTLASSPLAPTLEGRSFLATPKPGIRISVDDPSVHVDQEWKIAYEAMIPNSNKRPSSIGTTDGYQSLTLRNQDGNFCNLGVEDIALGAARVSTERAAGDKLGIAIAADESSRVADYVQIEDDILAADNPYWLENQADENGGSCWDPSLTSGLSRHDACVQAFGEGDGRFGNLYRDLPIIEAYEDHLVVSRYGYSGGRTDLASRVVNARDSSNVSFLKVARCCFHNQAKFRVRTGRRWLALGSVTGYLHHISKGPGGRCVQSCDSADVLLNSRAASVPRASGTMADASRNSALAFRNPFFSFVMFGPGDGASTIDRDLEWKFATRGQFVPFQVNLRTSSNQTDPAPTFTKSMRYVPALSNVAIVDGSSRGLTLFDLRSLSLRRDPIY